MHLYVIIEAQIQAEESLIHTKISIYIHIPKVYDTRTKSNNKKHR